MIFYKACFDIDLNKDYIPGTVTSDIQEAIKWFRRYSSKRKGDFFIDRYGIPVIIQIEFDENLLKDSKEFHQAGKKEHDVSSCWVSSKKDKAQINDVVTYSVMSEQEIIRYMV
jgi:hypothetical protein